MTRYSICVNGMVQGVGFRFFVQRNAMNLSITGWVKNNDDGSVEMEIQGSEENLDKLIEIIKKGNNFINVEEISIEEIKLKKEKNFKMIY